MPRSTLISLHNEPVTRIRRESPALPTPPTPLLGREREMAAVCAHLGEPEVRLLTLTGPGGCGKTRLALAAAVELRGSFRDGVAFVPLAAIADPALVLPAIARALDLPKGGDAPPPALLGAQLADHELLLLLDNCEQITRVAPDLAELLAAAPRLKLLVTSREVLHLQGELAFPVPTLAVPDPASTLDPSILAASPATALFAARAAAVAPGFALTAENAAAVAAICRRLDGLPLAIELAAARVRALSPTALLARLHHPLGTLTGGGRDLAPRQRTLRDTIGWSYNLLDRAEQRLFRHLATFVGGFTLDAVAAACTGRGAARQPATLDALTALLDRSMIVRLPDMPDGEPRFGMLETLREFATEQLERGPRSADPRRDAAYVARERHARYFLALAEAALPAFEGSEGPEQDPWLRKLSREHDNLRAALAWFHAAADGAAAALRLSGALWKCWWVYGYLGEGRRELEAALDRPAETPAAVRALALRGVAALAWAQGDIARAESAARDSLTLCREAGDTSGTAAALVHLANVIFAQGRYDEATASYAASLPIFRERGNQGDVAWVYTGLGNVAQREGDARRAVSHLERGLALFRECGFARGVAWALTGLGLAMLDCGERSRALTLLDEGLAIHRMLGDKGGIATALHHLGAVALVTGDLGIAEERYRESFALRHELGDRIGLATCLEGLARVAARRGRGLTEATRAVLLHGAAAALRDAITSPLSPFERAARERDLAAVRGRLGARSFAAVWEAGRQLSPEEAVAAPLPSLAADRSRSANTADELTARELDVLRLIAAGLTNAQAAGRLHLSPLTVNAHLRSIYGKLGVATRAAATRFAIEHALV
jgi:predicted ATPase/DNA-binding CsgD family transcriptional regulator